MGVSTYLWCIFSLIIQYLAIILYVWYQCFVFFTRVFSCIVFGAMGLGNASAFAPDLGKAQTSAKRIIHILDSKPSIDYSSPDGSKLPVWTEIDLYVWWHGGIRTKCIVCFEKISNKVGLLSWISSRLSHTTSHMYVFILGIQL